MKVSTAFAAAALSLSSSAAPAAPSSESQDLRVGNTHRATLSESGARSEVGQRLDQIHSTLSENPKEAQLWIAAGRCVAGLNPKIIAKPDVDRLGELVALGSEYFEYNNREAIELANRLERKAASGEASTADLVVLERVRGDYLTARDGFASFIETTLELTLKRVPLPGLDTDHLIYRALQSPLLPGGVVSGVFNSRIPWDSLPTVAQVSLLGLAESRDPAQALPMIALCQRIGCPAETLVEASRKFAAGLQGELGGKRPAGPYRTALASHAQDSNDYYIRLSDDVAPEFLAAAREIAANKLFELDERIAALQVIHDVTRGREAPVLALNSQVVEAAKGILQNPLIEATDILRMESIFLSTFLKTPESQIPSDQILELLHSNDRKEQVVGKFFYEALPGLFRNSAIPRVGELRSTAEALKDTPHSADETAELLEYLARRSPRH